MALTVEELLIRIGADFSELQGELKKSDALTKKSTKSMGSNFKKLGNQIRKGINSIAKWTLGIGAAGASLLSFRAILAGMNSADHLGKTADRLGLTTEALAGLQFAATQTGVPVAALETSFQRMNRRLADAAKGAGPAAKAIKELGLNAEALIKKEPDKAFADIAEAINKVEGQANKTRLAFALFDTEGGRLLNTMAVGAKGLEAYRKEAEELGITLSRTDVAKIEMANDTFDRLGRIIDGIAQQLGAQLAPALAFLSEQFITGGKNIVSMKRSFNDFVDGVATGVGIARTAWAGLQIMWLKSKEIIGDLSVVFWKTTRLVVKAISFWKDKWEQFVEVIKTSVVLITATLDSMWGGLVESIALNMAIMVSHVADAIRDISNSLMSSGIPAVQEMGLQLNDLATAAQVAAGAIFEGPSKAATDAKIKLDAAAKAGLDAGAAFRSMDVDLKTPKLDEQVALAEAFAKNATKAVEDLTQGLADAGAGALSKTVKDFKEFFAEYDATASNVEERNKAMHDKNNENSGTANKFQFEHTKQMADGVAGIFQNLASAVGAQSKKQFEVQKKLQIASAIVNTYSSAVGAYNAMASIPYVGPALGAAAAAAAVVAGLANVKRIQNTQFGGSSGGGGSGYGGAAAGNGSSGSSQTPFPEGDPRNEQQQQQAQTTQVNVTLQGNNFSRQQVRGLLGQIDEAVDDNATVNVVDQVV